MKYLLLISSLCTLLHSCTFAQNADSVSVAKIAALKDTMLPQLDTVFHKYGLVPGDSVLIRVFKQEKELELWVAKGSDLVLLKTFPVCAASGKPGPKRKEGDMQVPEGIYSVQYFNPESNFHLSFLISYPNEADRYFSDKEHPGGQICVHGECASIGCVAIRDEPIEFVFLSALLAEGKGQTAIPVHVFPCRMETENLRLLYIAFPQHQAFWDNLKTIYDRFERKPQFLNIKVDKKGAYVIRKK